MIVDALIVNVTPGQTPGVARIYIYFVHTQVYLQYRKPDFVCAKSDFSNCQDMATRCQPRCPVVLQTWVLPPAAWLSLTEPLQWNYFIFTV